MSIKPCDAEAMIKTAKDNKVTLGVIFQNRYNPGSQAYKKHSWNQVNLVKYWQVNLRLLGIDQTNIIVIVIGRVPGTWRVAEL